uniref:Metallo-beta-lactamase domain-containing protein n=1 Tax=Esox lucius TaxID=8010 RepID=A0AAY5L258_ESOLU
PRYVSAPDTKLTQVCQNASKRQAFRFCGSAMTVRCTKHYWMLNVSIMQHVNLPDSFTQDELVDIVMTDDGGLQLVEVIVCDPWLVDPKDPQDQQEGEVTYLTHACMELTLGRKGPAFARGWWLLHEHPADSMETVRWADLIYFSNMHSDHLRYTEKMARDLMFPIYVGNTSRPQHHHANKCNLPMQVLNTMVCTRPNNGRMPHNVDLMMSDFAGGMCGNTEYRSDFIKIERKKLLNNNVRLVKSSQPRIYCPFAGYFVKAHASEIHNMFMSPLSCVYSHNSHKCVWVFMFVCVYPKPCKYQSVLFNHLLIKKWKILGSLDTKPRSGRPRNISV